MADYTNTSVCIMAGGVGSRFWPSSREELPKQFLDISGKGKSLIRMTYERFARFVPAERIYVVTHENYRRLTAEHLPELEPSHIIGEPLRRNTGPAALLGTLAAADPDRTNVIMAPADHLIRKEKEFRRCLDTALDYLHKDNALITIGIRPTRPHTGYGYIKYRKEGDPPYPVERFTEKPDRERARAFLDEGNYLWNAGIFVWNAEFLFENYRRHAPAMWKAFLSLKDKPPGQWSAGELARIYSDIEGISVDYLIMEKAEKVRTIPGDIGWSDVGSWSALYEISEKDANGNVVLGDKIVDQGLKGCLVKSSGRRIVIARGLENFLLIDEDDVLLLMPLANDQQIKQIRAEVIDRFGKERS